MSLKLGQKHILVGIFNMDEFVNESLPKMAAAFKEGVDSSHFLTSLLSQFRI